MPEGRARIAIIGNSGAGKSTLARFLVAQGRAELLDLDTVAWEPGRIAVARDRAAAEKDVRDFCERHERWIVEGCYANLMRTALAFAPILLFLDPGEEQCRANCRSRPWEPHKYPSKREQDRHLPMLLDWVSDYRRRDGETSFSAHEALYLAYGGLKRRFDRALVLDPSAPEFPAWLV